MRAVFMVVALGFAWAAGHGEAHADNSHNTGKLELQTMFAMGGPIGLMGDRLSDISTQTFTAMAAARLRSPKYSIVGIEANYVYLSGFGATMLFDVWRSDRIRVHVLDLGIFWNGTRPVSVMRLPRAYDVTLGAGVELRFGRWSMTFDWRANLPDPYGTLSTYGGFSRQWYAEAVKGGQVCGGVSYSWPLLR